MTVLSRSTPSSSRGRLRGGEGAEKGGEGRAEPLPGGEDPPEEDGEWLANAEPLAGDEDPWAQGGEGPAARCPNGPLL